MIVGPEPFNAGEVLQELTGSLKNVHKVLKDRIVYIVDNDEQVCASMALLLRSLGILPQCFNGGAVLLDRLHDLEPGCVLLDIDLPDIDAFYVIEALAVRQRQLPVVVISAHGDVATAVRAMQVGAGDFIAKPIQEDSLPVVLARMFAKLGKDLLHDERRLRAVARLTRLTERETHVLHGLIGGQPNKILAHDLGLSVRTVEMHRSSLMNRLGVDSLAQALHLAFDAGMYFEAPLPKPRSQNQQHDAEICRRSGIQTLNADIHVRNGLDTF